MCVTVCYMTQIHSTSPHALTKSLNLLADTYNYNHWIYSLMRPFLGDVLCEVGAGIGNLTRFFLNARRLVCIEPEPEYWDTLQQLSAIHRNITVARCGIEAFIAGRNSSERFDSVVCVNVLEHIQEQEHALRMMTNLLRPQGVVLLYVPACPWAYGRLDEALGHYRRYSKKQVKHLAHVCRLRLVQCRYVNCIGAFGWWWHSRVRKNAEIKPGPVRSFDRFVPYISALEHFLPLVVGQSLFAVLQQA